MFKQILRAKEASALIEKLVAARDSEKAIILQRFFKTGPGNYGQNDKFLGIPVPATRSIVREYKHLELSDIDVLLSNEWHEVRLAALVILINQFRLADEAQRSKIYKVYINQIGKGINNWDLVDTSCPKIVGSYLYDKKREQLYELASGGLWQKRVSIISTFWFLKKGETADTYKIAEILFKDRHDLIQKAVGWALREMGKVDLLLLYKFLDSYATDMPRTELRYSIEKLSDDKKKYYMSLAKLIHSS